VVFLIFIFSFTARAHVPADGNIRASLGPYGYATHEWHNHFESPFMGGLGLLVEGDLNKHGGLEIGMFYINKVFSVTKDDQTVTERAKRIYISMGYRHWWNKKNSVSLAFFSSYSMGDPKTLHSDFPPGGAPKTSASDMTEYGFDASYQHEPWSAGRWAAIVDLRYSYSVTPKGFEDSNHYGVLLALKYFVQARDKDLDKMPGL
jgi:hypothetical protein